MAKINNKVIEELIETAKKLPKDAQDALLQLGRDLIFIESVKNGSK